MTTATRRAVGIELTTVQLATLREARLLLGLSCELLAAKIGLRSHVAIVRYEQGQSRPSAEVLERWVDVLGYQIVPTALELKPKARRRK